MFCPPFSYEKVSTYFRTRQFFSLPLTVCGMSSGDLRTALVSHVAKLKRVDEAKFMQFADITYTACCH